MVGNDKIPARLQPGGDTFLVCPGDGSGEQARETTGFAFFLTSVEKSEAVTNCDHLGRLKFSRRKFPSENIWQFQ